MTDETTYAAPAAPRGLAAWMRRALAERERAQRGLDADAVHDLRVALRRCRSIADSLGRIDPSSDWRALKRVAKPLFAELSGLRDAHVVVELARRIAPPSDPVLPVLLDRLVQREEGLRQRALQAIDQFETRKWKALTRKLPRRATSIRPAVTVFKTSAVEQWQQANDLHRRALAGRSRVAWHRLRIGIKRFRYVVENFLPGKYELWGDDLRHFQDLLGEVHDLDVLWSELLRLRPMISAEARRNWSTLLEGERRQRLDEYRQRATGTASIWTQWREGLPEGARLRAASLDRMAAWASFLDPDPAGARNRRRLVLDLAQGLYAAGLGEVWGDPDALRVLEAATLLQDVGRARGSRNHHKRSRSLIRGLPPPPGWTDEELRQTALVARYHRGAEPDPSHDGYRRLGVDARRRVAELASVLRLANALDPGSAAHVLGVDIDAGAEVIRVIASGYEPSADSAARIARGKHLLERIVGRPIAVVPRSPRPRLVLVAREAT